MYINSSGNQFTIKFVFFIPYTSLYIIPYIPLHYCLINIHIFDYPASRLSRLFTQVPTSLDNQGSTAQCIWVYIISESSDSHQHTKEPLAVTIGHLNMSFVYERIYRYVHRKCDKWSDKRCRGGQHYWKNFTSFQTVCILFTSLQIN